MFVNTPARAALKTVAYKNFSLIDDTIDSVVYIKKLSSESIGLNNLQHCCSYKYN